MMMIAEMPPPPSKVTATKTVKEDQVAVIERDGIRLGTSDDAGQLCVTERSPKGVSGDVYRWYVREQGAPGPYQVRNPITRKPMPATDENDRELFDLDAVVAWNASRPGPGTRVHHNRPPKWTQLRGTLVAGARDGHLQLRRDGRPYLGDDELRAFQVQRIGELESAGLIRPPRGKQGGRYALTAAGRRWLDEHGAR